MIKPVDIARQLNISTSALRHYESWGLIPEVKRKANGYRKYTEEHVAYFSCIRAMNSGFGMHVIREIMPLIQEKRTTEAIWKVSKVHAELYQDKVKAEQALEVLNQEDGGGAAISTTKKKWYNIGEAAEAVGVPTSTLRHWEKEELITPDRDKESGYRKYAKNDLQKLVLIRTLQQAVYSLDVVRDVLSEVNNHNLKEAVKMTRDALMYLDYMVKEQLRGMSYLYRLCDVVEGDEEDAGDEGDCGKK